MPPFVKLSSSHSPATASGTKPKEKVWKGKRTNVECGWVSFGRNIKSKRNTRRTALFSLTTLQPFTAQPSQFYKLAAASCFCLSFLFGLRPLPPPSTLIGLPVLSSSKSCGGLVKWKKQTDCFASAFLRCPMSNKWKVDAGW